MPPLSASKQKRLAEKAAKQAAKASGADTSVSSPTPPGSTNGGSSLNTPLTSLSAATSQEDLSSMAKLQIATDRSVFLGLHFMVYF
jgi:ATP-binding cassette subfamily F protein 2